MKIQRKTVYRFNDVDYQTFAKAKDAAEDRVGQFLTARLRPLGFSASEAYKIVTLIINDTEIAGLSNSRRE